MHKKENIYYIYNEIINRYLLFTLSILIEYVTSIHVSKKYTYRIIYI